MWRSAERFRGLAFAWRKQRWNGDEMGYQLIEAWRYRDEHLQRYEAGLLRHGLSDRHERYRILAANLASRHRTLVIDNTDLREFQRSPTPESGRVELRAALVNAFGEARVMKLCFERITMPCHGCGQIDQWDPAATLMHTCSSCGKTWDQDRNACLNLLAKGRREREGAADGTVGARTQMSTPRKESRSERLRRNRWKDRPAEAAREA
jgi:hypothetical protein